MTEFERFEMTHEGQLYKRIGTLETELATAQKRIADLESESEIWWGRTKYLFRTIALLIGVCVLLMILVGVAAAYILWVK
jgi:hypothetical protein